MHNLIIKHNLQNKFFFAKPVIILHHLEFNSTFNENTDIFYFVYV